MVKIEFFLLLPIENHCGQNVENLKLCFLQIKPASLKSLEKTKYRSIKRLPCCCLSSRSYTRFCTIFPSLSQNNDKLASKYKKKHTCSHSVTVKCLHTALVESLVACSFKHTDKHLLNIWTSVIHIWQTMLKAINISVIIKQLLDLAFA